MVAQEVETATATPRSPVATPTPLSNDYYVIVKERAYGGNFEYIADFPSWNEYYVKLGSGLNYVFKNPEIFFDYLLKEGTVTARQRKLIARGDPIAIPYNDLALAVYKLIQSRGKGYLNRQFGIGTMALDYLLYFFDEPLLDSGKNRPDSSSPFDAASVLARFSTNNPAEGEERADSVGEIVAQYKSGNADTARVVALLHTIAPELSIDERRRAADKLARLSEDDQWDETETASAVFYLAALVTGDEPNPGERIEAAHEMVALYEAGDLDAETSLDLMDTLAPSLSITSVDRLPLPLQSCPPLTTGVPLTGWLRRAKCSGW